MHGDAGYDTWFIDPRRFTTHGNVELCALKAIEDYQNECRFHFPHEHRPVSGFNRFEITGPDDFLDRMDYGRVTKKPGRVGLGYLLNHHGMVKAEATLANRPSPPGPTTWIGCRPTSATVRT